MRPVSLTVTGFRSLGKVGPIPVRNPTILTGHNDSGKSATLDALAFLLGAYQPTDEDRTYEVRHVEPPGTGDLDTGTDDCEPDKRVRTISVEGEFELSDREQEDLGLGRIVRIRRIYSDRSARMDLLADVSADPRLRDLESKSLTELKGVAGDIGLKVDGDTRRKDTWLESLEKYAAAGPRVEDWTSLSQEVKGRLPRFLRFGDADAAETVVKAALTSRYKIHLDDDDLKQQVHDLEQELSRRVRQDAQGLIRHIQDRCTDLVLVDIEPSVSFTSGLRSTKLRLARRSGEEVSLSAVGAGRARRISLAIWEWTSEILKKDATGHANLDEIQDVVIAYDEPDTHLDYLQQRRVMKLIREQCEVPGVSMVIATHSMNLIDGASIDDLVHLNLDGERTVATMLFHDLDDVENGRFLSDIAAALGLRNTVLLHERCFVGVEGPTEQHSFPLMFRLSTGRSVQSAGIVIIGCHNNEGALKFVGYLARTGRQVLLAIDADSQRLRIFSDANLAKEGLTVDQHVRFIGGPDKELETTFSNEQWSQLANAVWPRSDSTSWLASHVETAREGKFSSKLLELFKSGSNSGPSSKTEMMYEMARGLKHPDEIPQELRDLFWQLEKLASLDA
ncbi:TOPRIM nucleotidyl transferase/hydrolase domain-containing protein [Micromonospora chalcea]|uniref:TOPRIM nucleotidyl transferase/hydrolase domain-containing protein n=1 Tax=Micromonospora chalcea TaxID=1874 RepID=UPI003D722490